MWPPAGIAPFYLRKEEGGTRTCGLETKFRALGRITKGSVPAEGQSQGDEAHISRQPHGEDNGLEKAGSAGVEVPSSSPCRGGKRK